MTLVAGAKLGPYEILGPIGAGGMGEVYRARDPRLGREVAIKILPASFSPDPDRLRRFEQEARAAGVSTTRTSRRSTTSVSTTARPTSSRSCSRARRCAPSSRAGPSRRAERSTSPSRSPRARRGAREGHRPPGHEAREPLRHDGRPRQDPRLRPGKAAFAERSVGGALRPAHGERAAPNRASFWERSVHVARAGAREAGRRAQRHLFFRRRPLRDALGPPRLPRRLGRGHDVGDPQGGPAGPLADEQGRPARASNGSCATASRRTPSSDSTPRTTSRSRSRRSPASRRPRLEWFRRARAAGRGSGRQLAAAAIAAAGYLGLARRPPAEPPVFRQLTFYRGAIGSARFTPDGHSVVYSADWDGNRKQLFRPGSDFRTRRRSESPARTTSRHHVFGRDGRLVPEPPGFTLARAPLTGGSPREIAEDIGGADISREDVARGLALDRRRVPPRVPDRQVALPDGGPRQRPAHLTGRPTRRLLRSSAARRRPRNACGRGPRRQEDDVDGSLGEHARHRLDPVGPRDLVHRVRAGREPGRPCRHPRREGAAGALRSGPPDSP